MKICENLTVERASVVYPITLTLLLSGSWISSKLLGFAWSLWVNQGVFLVIAAFLAWKNKWSWREIYRFRGTDINTALTALLAGFGLWWGGLAFNVWSERLIIRLFGTQPSPQLELTSIESFVIIIALVVLAPIIEEILFRGYYLRALEAQTTRPWLWSGLLFGVMHIGNGLASVIPATIYGFVLGYMVWRSNSIVVGILAHMGINFNAVFLGGAMQQFILANAFPLELLLISLVGFIVFCFGFFGFRHFQNHIHLQSDHSDSSITLRSKQWSALFLALMILVGMGVLDVSTREPANATGYTSMTAGRLTGDIIITEIEVTKAPDTLVFTYKFSSDVSDTVLEVLDPNDNVIWSKELIGNMISQESTIEVALDGKGIYKVYLKGISQDMKFDANWEVAR
ncbi:CPBP family intramembrane glutamic endopeptidase [Alkaliphilus hydrothermalis]|uniref:Membrane protease YdiL (CAAX protease family) n=1 Tax=Alkaliphilus hydrothermalis TaxID=1482730 RepID=A0ABS2NS56_9FIRM|nr:type II CAAX endopeptidase family protein [Alkaliphilus hydrothermalis]MBM7615746.1 membrane protease YdiL (CAAX protease family) [Alkaliphilus hydrothermalis]